MEIEVACRYKLPIIIIILNNNGIYDGMDSLDSVIPPPPNCLLPGSRYEQLADAFGGKGYYVNTPIQFRNAFSDALIQNVPTIINVIIDTQSKRRVQQFDWLTRSKL